MIIWDTTQQFYSWPKKIKILYSKIYKKNFRKFNYWIDEISKDNLDNTQWWLSRPASRDERVSNLFHNICIFFTYLKIKKTQTKIIIYSDSGALIQKIKKLKNKNCILILKHKKKLLKRLFIFLKEFFIQFLNLSLIKFYKKNKLKNKKINLIDKFQISTNLKKDNFSKNIINKNEKFLIVPTFIEHKPRKILFFLNKKNFLLKEVFLSYFDIFKIFFYLVFNKIKLKKKFLNYDFDNLIEEEYEFDENLRSIIISYINIFFFKNLNKGNYKIGKVYSWHENQIIDKGWSLGINRYFPKTQFIGYQESTIHPQFFNLSTTNQEFFSGVIPKKIMLIGRFYLNNRKLFSKKVDFSITPKNRFLFTKKNKKKKYILFLLSGIKNVDKIMIKIFNEISKMKLVNLKIKFHPILPSKNFSEKTIQETKINAANLINQSKLVITSSYTSALYESLANNIQTIMIYFSPLDVYLFKKLKKYSKKIYLIKDIEEIKLRINKINKLKNFNYTKNKKVRQLFFNK